MGTQITRLTRLAAAGLSAVLVFATTACAATSPAETEPDNKTSVPAPTGPINVVASLNQWGSLAAELGGDDVEVTSIVNSTNVDAHDFEPKTSDVAKLSKAQIIVANGAGYDSWATKSMTKTRISYPPLPSWVPSRAITRICGSPKTLDPAWPRPSPMHI